MVSNPSEPANCWCPCSLLPVVPLQGMGPVQPQHHQVTLVILLLNQDLSIPDMFQSSILCCRPLWWELYYIKRGWRWCVSDLCRLQDLLIPLLLYPSGRYFLFLVAKRRHWHVVLLMSLPYYRHADGSSPKLPWLTLERIWILL